MLETKLFSRSEVKLAVSTDTDTKTMTISGYGAVFNNTDSYGDVIVPGAFRDSIKAGSLPLMFLNHDPYSLPIGKWTDLEEDDTGLRVKGEFIDTSTGRDTYAAAKSGAITGLSIGFRPVEVIKGSNKNDPARLIKSVELVEVSVVTFPANDLARISDVKSLEQANEFEKKLMRLGMTLKEAKTFLKDHKRRIETKYNEAATIEAAKTLLLTIQGEK